VNRLIGTAVAHDAIAAANGWRDNETTERLAREHHVTRNGATGEEITEFERFFENPPRS
jgi:hypothetical protein